jgi:hypothetical protein
MEPNWEFEKEEFIKAFVDSMIKEARDVRVEFDKKYVAKLRIHGETMGKIWMDHQMELQKRMKENLLP